MNIDNQPPDNLPLSLNLAAKQLGCSPLTIRRMIKDGRLRATKISRPQGYTYQIGPADLATAKELRDKDVEKVVHLDEQINVSQDEQANVQSDNIKSDPEQQNSHGLDTLIKLVEKQTNQIATLSYSLAESKTETKQLKEQIKLLQPPTLQTRWYKRLLPWARAA